MKVALCEDNDVDLNEMRGVVKDYCEKNHFLVQIFSYHNDDVFWEHFSNERFDVVFMDIMMHRMSGLRTARKIYEKDPACILIFVAASKEYALDAYSIDAISYIVKPVQECDIIHALEKCRQKFMKNSRFLMVPVGRQKYLRLPFVTIHYVEVYGREVWFHTDSQIIKTSGMTLSEVECELGGEPFLRCHRSYIVNMDSVEKLQDGVFQIKNGDCVPIRKRGYAQVHLTFSQFITKNGG